MNSDPYLISKMKVLEHLKALIDIMSFKFQHQPKLQLTLPSGKWTETIERGKTIMDFVLDEEI